MWSHLSQNLDLDDPSYSDALRRVMARLGDYAALLIEPLKALPIGATLVMATNQRIEVRVATQTSNILLVIAPEADLAHEVFFLRAMALKALPAPRLITHDLSCATVPFTYAILSYLGGMTLDRVTDTAFLRVAARQAGRTLRRVHQIEAPGYGAPTPSGRWPARTWPEALAVWLERRGVADRAEEALGAEVAAALRATTLDHPACACPQPRVLHGAPDPAHMLVTSGESVYLEALARPEPPVGGDPMFDLAHALASRWPAAFRQGILEGYEMAGALTATQHERIDRLRLLSDVADALDDADPAVLAGLAEAVTARIRALEG